MRRVNVYRVEGVDYRSEAIEGDHGRVDTIVRAREATTELNWEFVRTPKGWRVSDYSIDGVSTVRNYRRQFAKLLETKGWNGLVERINNRAAEIEVELQKEVD
jgi:phospholipid transport system substrate-binding protein